MKLEDLLRDRKDAVVQRWVEDVMSAYPAPAAAVLARRKDRFANPVGHSLRAGLGGIFEELLDGHDAGTIQRHLREIIRIRAVQQLTAAQAVGFVFRLKDAVRAEIGTADRAATLGSDLADLERKVDEIALAAFGIYVECREQICELRVNEVKRRVSWVMERQSQ
ncbi:MAG: RsbRD N-terminal domain-containing protein [Planctomycetota bacterium]|jgi:NAD-specific glutamate dehydrogenase